MGARQRMGLLAGMAWVWLAPGPPARADLMQMLKNTSQGPVHVTLGASTPAGGSVSVRIKAKDLGADRKDFTLEAGQTAELTFQTPRPGKPWTQMLLLDNPAQAGLVDQLAVDLMPQADGDLCAYRLPKKTRNLLGYDICTKADRPRLVAIRSAGKLEHQDPPPSPIWNLRLLAGALQDRDPGPVPPLPAAGCRLRLDNRSGRPCYFSLVDAKAAGDALLWGAGDQEPKAFGQGASHELAGGASATLVVTAQLAPPVLIGVTGADPADQVAMGKAVLRVIGTGQDQVGLTLTELVDATALSRSFKVTLAGAPGFDGKLTFSKP